MKKKAFSAIIAVCLACALLFSGCDFDMEGYVGNLRRLVSWIMDGGSGGVATFEDMVYTRPDVTEYQTLVEQSCQVARESKDLERIVEAIWAVYDAYDSFYTNLNLANIHYSADLTDIYWQQENDYCMTHTAEVDAGLDALYYALADSPLRGKLEGEDYFGAGYFDAYDGESIWDETFVELMTRESELVNQYYDLAGRALETEYYSDAYFETYGSQMAQLYVELVTLRQQIAAYLGYDSYLQFAYDYYYYRDYTPEQAASYLEQIRTQLVPLYRRVNASGVWDEYWDGYSEKTTFAYVQNCAEDMGGTIAQCFRELKDRKLYDLSFGANKYDSSFEVYLYSYQLPYIFTNPDGSAYDPLTFAHEFGHFCNEYVCGGSYAGTDVAEVFSQGMEYLSLCYGKADSRVRKLKMLDCLNIYVEQAAYASFEQQVYGLTGEELTVENVQALYEQVGTDFGFPSWNWDSRDFVTMPHYFTNPMYIISYVVSNDAAFQLYQLEQAEEGSGLARYEAHLQSEESYFLSFLESAGLESPFTEGRLESVRQVLEAELG